MRRIQFFILLLLVVSIGSPTFASTSTIQNLLTNGAGKSGHLPPGLLTAPGIAKKLGSIPPPPPVATGTLAVAFDPSSPPVTTVVPGQAGVEIARLVFTGTGEAIDLTEMALYFDNGQSDVVTGSNVTLWTTDGTYLGTINLCAGVCRSGPIAPGAFRIPRDGSKTIVIKGDISPNIAPGSWFDIGYYLSQGVGVSTGVTINNSNADFHVALPTPIYVVAP